VTFSIITITFNSSRYLEETITSVVSQDGADLEYIIIDGGSSDGTLDIVRRHAAADARIRWQSEPDEGISDAFNKGIRLARGTFVGILNSDDVYAAGVLKKVAQAFAEHPECDVVHGDMIRFQGDRPLFRLSPAAVDERVWHDMPLNHPATFVRRSAYEQVGLFDIRLRVAMDYEMVFRLYRAGCRFHYLADLLAHMRYGGASDERFLAARKEVYAVTVAAGYPRWKAGWWFVIKSGLNMTKNVLRTLGLHSLIRLHPKFRHHQGGT
jgi:glycosyltransferase involved in cell wall biosynthesis